jgi:hypothetical protein
MPAPELQSPVSPRIATDATVGGSRLTRFGSAVAAALLSAVIATLPAAFRVVPSLTGSQGRLAGYAALLALALGPVAIATVVVRHAVVGARLFDRTTLEPFAWAVAATFAVASGALTVLGAGLRATTHHHGLAGVTFAALGVVTIVGAALLSSRGVQVVVRAPRVVRLLGAVALAAVVSMEAAVVVRVLGARFFASAPANDVMAFLVATVFGAGAFPRRGRPSSSLALGGPPLAVAVLVVGLMTVRSSPSLRATIEGQAPLAAGLLLVASPPPPPSDAAH